MRLEAHQPSTLGKMVATFFGPIFVACVPLFLVTVAVSWAFNDPGLYYRGFQKYNVSRVTGINESDLRQVGAELRSYFNSGNEPKPPTPPSFQSRPASTVRNWSFSTSVRSCTCGT